MKHLNHINKVNMEIKYLFMIFIFSLFFVPITYAESVDGYKNYKFGMTLKKILNVTKEKGDKCFYPSKFGSPEITLDNLAHPGWKKSPFGAVKCTIGKYETWFYFDHPSKDANKSVKHFKTYFLSTAPWNNSSAWKELISGLSPLSQLWVNFGKYSQTLYKKLHNAMSKKYGLISKYTDSEKSDFNNKNINRVKNLYADKSLSLEIVRDSKDANKYVIWASYLSKVKKSASIDDDI